MAIVYEASEVAQRRVPRDGVHELVAEEFFAYLGQLAASGIVIAGIEYGSVGSEVGPNERSDLDVAVIIGGPLRQGLAIKAELEEAAAELTEDHYVRFDLHIATTAELRDNPFALGDELLAEQMAHRQRTTPYTIGDVAGQLDDVNLAKLHEAQRVDRAGMCVLTCLAEKTKLFETVLKRDDIRAIDIQRALELPTALGRRIVRLLQVSGELPGDATTLLDRQQAGQSLSELARHTGDRRWLVADELNDLNQAYTRILKATIAGRMKVRDYERWLFDNRVRIIKAALRLTEPAWMLIKQDYIRDMPDLDDLIA